MFSFRTIASVSAVALIVGGSLAAALPQAGHSPVVTEEAYQVDPVHSTALFRVHHLGAGQFWGRFNDVTGTIVVDGESDTPTRFDISIATESVDTNSEGLDRHLKSSDFFNVREYPAMTFQGSAIEESEPGLYRLTGELTIHGVTKEVTVDLEHTGTAEGRGGTRIGFEARFTIARSEFGMMYGVNEGMLGDETKVIVGLEAIAQPAGE